METNIKKTFLNIFNNQYFKYSIKKNHFQHGWLESEYLKL